MNCRFLYLIGQLESGGAERQLYYLLRATDRERYKPAVAVWNFREDDFNVPVFQSLGIRVHSFLGLRSSIMKLLAFRRLVKELNPEIVHSYSYFTNFAAWYSTLGSRAIPIGSIRQDFLNECHDAGIVLGRLSGRWPATQICNSLAAIQTLKASSYLFKPTRLEFVTNRMDIDRFRPHPLPKKTPVLLGIGRLTREKRWDRLLRCVASVASKGLDLSVSIAGDGPLMNELKGHASALGVNKQVNFLGLCRDIPSLLKNSTFLIHTPDAEGCPNVVMEAMAGGRAVVATDAGDIPSLVEDSKTGFVVGRGDDGALVDRTIRLITDRDLCRRMGEAGRGKAEREFGLHRLVDETLNVYRAAAWKDA